MSLNIDHKLKAHLESLPEQFTQQLKDQFDRDMVVPLSHLLPQDLAAELSNEAHALMDEQGQRRALTLEITGGTPRAYRSVGRDAIHAKDGIIRKIFESEAVRTYLSELADEELHRCPYEPEEYIINSQEKTGDTHGWHFDDYTFALIWIIDAPDPLKGGRVEFINYSEWQKDKPREQLCDLLSTREVRSMYVPAGTCYLMRASKVLHRVTPLAEGTRRTVIVYTYASDQDLRDDTISHDTMEMIYSPEVHNRGIGPTLHATA